MTPTTTRRLYAALIAAPLLGVAVWPVSAQPPAPAAHPDKPHGDKPADREEEKSEWREKYKEELKEHPRLAKALIELHEAKDYLVKAPHDFGGHREAAVKACDDAIKQVKEAIKYDIKHEEKDKKKGEKGEKGAGGTTTSPPK